MANNLLLDQAAGLRRMLAAPRLSLCTVLSADALADKTALMERLATGLARKGQAVILLDARNTLTSQPGQAGQPTLQDVAHQRASLLSSTRATPYGYDCMLLSRNPVNPADPDDKLQQLLRQVASHKTRILVDAALDDDGQLPLPILAEGDLIVQLSGSPASIKQAYVILGQLKDLRPASGRTPSLLVSAGDAAQARQIHANLSQAASRYLALQIKSVVAPHGIGRQGCQQGSHQGGRHV